MVKAGLEYRSDPEEKAVCTDFLNEISQTMTDRRHRGCVEQNVWMLAGDVRKRLSLVARTREGIQGYEGHLGELVREGLQPPRRF